MKTWIYRWGPAILLMAIIFLASATPASDFPGLGSLDLLVKKGGHMIGYALLAASYHRALNKRKVITKQHLALAICLTVLYAASDEWHQSYTPGRNASFLDIGIDIIGGLIGISAVQWMQRRYSTLHAAARADLE